ncbi:MULTISPECIES: 50S ribosomal protein L33 [Spiroplasma]|uniref:Large ribosomal subunit protein bL33 n=1 Tax=Spiroplasma eriocheiris TaxID=315358 RepID=A0A0H3XL07_9MOLU|nr:50S ribosomal protein L33 [Spiroplasma eriocheiris]AHF57718.1 50S ribosomal protein L33 [Spiroplasma eriocheiris CCTCC M 207170]AKM54169.1 50S ribosomal protein L33 [Spiroplasma eriocheiris]
MREGIILRCDQCKEENYIAKRDKKKHQEKLELKKYCSRCNAHTLHKEKK